MKGMKAPRSLVTSLVLPLAVGWRYRADANGSTIAQSRAAPSERHGLLGKERIHRYPAASDSSRR
ncbi:hypothetical protein JCM17961_12640 [Endothiovibrio diazotrophicus]